jgi:hypothetical protein
MFMSARGLPWEWSHKAAISFGVIRLDGWNHGLRRATAGRLQRVGIQVAAGIALPIFAAAIGVIVSTNDTESIAVISVNKRFVWRRNILVKR